MFGSVPAFVNAGQAIPFPIGTSVKTNMPTWALYINPVLNRSWLAYKTQRGTRIVPMGGIRNIQHNTQKLGEYVAQRRYSTCSECP